MSDNSIPDDLYDIDVLAAILECCENTYPLNPHLGKPNSNTKEGNRKRAKTYRVAHPDRIKAWGMNTRAGRQQSGKGLANDIEAIYRSQKGLCWWCGKAVGDDYHVDHRVPFARGGTNDPRNLCISCADCNFSKKDKLPHEWSGRLL